MLSRVRRIEALHAPAVSPIAQAFRSFEAFGVWADAQMAAGVLDNRDFPIVVHCLERWERDGTAWGKRRPYAGAWSPGR
jgi:hypothetical protein